MQRAKERSLMAWLNEVQKGLEYGREEIETIVGTCIPFQWLEGKPGYPLFDADQARRVLGDMAVEFDVPWVPGDPLVNLGQAFQQLYGRPMPLEADARTAGLIQRLGNPVVGDGRDPMRSFWPASRVPERASNAMPKVPRPTRKLSVASFARQFGLGEEQVRQALREMEGEPGIPERGSAESLQSWFRNNYNELAPRLLEFFGLPPIGRGRAPSVDLTPLARQFGVPLEDMRSAAQQMMARDMIPRPASEMESFWLEAYGPEIARMARTYFAADPPAGVTMAQLAQNLETTIGDLAGQLIELREQRELPPKPRGITEEEWFRVHGDAAWFKLALDDEARRVLTDLAGVHGGDWRFTLAELQRLIAAGRVPRPDNAGISSWFKRYEDRLLAALDRRSWSPDRGVPGVARDEWSNAPR